MDFEGSVVVKGVREGVGAGLVMWVSMRLREKVVMSEFVGGPVFAYKGEILSFALGDKKKK